MFDSQRGVTIVSLFKSRSSVPRAMARPWLQPFGKPSFFLLKMQRMSFCCLSHFTEPSFEPLSTTMTSCGTSRVLARMLCKHVSRKSRVL